MTAFLANAKLAAIVCSIVGAALGCLWAYIRGRSDNRAAVDQATEELNKQLIRPFQEEIGKQQAVSIRETEKFKAAKEAYDAKWRNRVRNSNPGSSDSNDGSGSGNPAGT